MQKDGLRRLINRERTVDLFLELVQIDSVSKEERKLADRIIGLAGSLNLDIREDGTAEKIGGDAGNLIISVPGDEGQAAILLSAHLDRVEPGRGIKPVIKGEYIESSGDTILGADDLIGVTAIMEAVRIIKENQLEHRPTKIIFFSGGRNRFTGGQEPGTGRTERPQIRLCPGWGWEDRHNYQPGAWPDKIQYGDKGTAAHAGMEPERESMPSRWPVQLSPG